jgi:EAL and modified HD-GYP domain-containing signal transduction protein
MPGLRRIAQWATGGIGPAQKSFMQIMQPARNENPSAVPTALDAPARQIFIGRQPIFDRDQRVYGYELLFRNGQVDSAQIVDGDQATAQTLVNGIMDFGLEQIVGSKLAFVNLTRNFLLQQDRLPALQKRVVLEVLEDITPDPQVIAALQALAARGYAIALDDFTYREELLPFVKVAQIIKLDVSQIGVEALPRHVECLRPHKRRLLAEKVETHEEFELCKSLGIDYFQGYFLSKPVTLAGKRLPANKLAVLQILAKVQDPNTSMGDLEKLISTDVSLSYRILRFVNSVQFAAAKQIDNVRRAIIMTGLYQIRTWVSLIVLSRLDDKPPELIRIALVRSRLCELFSRRLGLAPPETYATAGLFSTLDALLDQPLEEILGSLPLNAEIADALLKGSGRIGEVLQGVLACERGDWESAARLGVGDEALSRAYLDAIAWADANSRALTER